MSVVRERERCVAFRWMRSGEGCGRDGCDEEE